MKSFLKLASMMWILVGLVGCNLQSGESDEALRQALKQATVSDFCSFYPRHYSYIINWGNSRTGPSLIAVTFVNQRYEVIMRVPLKVDRLMSKLIGVGDPEYFVKEFKTVGKDVSGRWYIEFQEGNQLRFGINDWLKVLRAGGDLRAVGLKTFSNEPVPGVDDYWRDKKPGVYLW